jgi:sigma-B regulation protein RsbU (phosphoserine phosphatase)
VVETVSVLELPPDPTAPGLARSFVARALASPGQEELQEVGQLLVSELVTNAVVHAASAVEIELERDADAVTVRVRDADTGPLVMRAGGGSELDEGGRGFVLVDRLAEAWGTEHRGGRKTVWFRLAPRGSAAGRVSTPVPKTSPDPVELSATHKRLRTLVLRPALQRNLTFTEHVAELLARVVDAVRGTGAAVTLAGQADPLAVVGRATEPSTHHELVADDRRLGTLTVHLGRQPDDDDEAFLSLAADRIALLAAEHGLLRAGHERAAELDYLSEATELLAGSLSVQLSLTLVTQIVVPRLADWCAAYTVDDRGRPRRLIVNHRREDRVEPVTTILETDRELRQVVRDAAAGGAAHRLLTSRAQPLGVMVLGRAEPLDAVTFMATLELARRAALAVDNARLHEEQTATATALQASLLPAALPTVDGVELAARYHSAAPGMLVGGDFYDAVSVGDGSFVFAIGDVCGKGAEAAAVTGMSRDLLRYLVQDGKEMSDALRRLNRALVEHPNSSRFCTVALTRLLWRDGSLVARLCLAGHPEPMLLRADGSTDLVGTPGDLLGVLPDDALDLEVAEVPLAPGDALVLYTDGVTERRAGRRMFGQHGLRTTLEQSRGADAETLASNIDQAARTFVDAEMLDDLAILVIRREP